MSRAFLGQHQAKGKSMGVGVDITWLLVGCGADEQLSQSHKAA